MYSLHDLEAYNQKHINNTLKPSLNWVFSLEIVLACYPSLSNNFWHKHLWCRCRGRNWISSLGYLSFFLVWEVDLNQHLWRLFSPKSLRQWLLEELEKFEDFSHPQLYAALINFLLMKAFTVGSHFCIVSFLNYWVNCVIYLVICVLFHISMCSI